MAYIRGTHDTPYLLHGVEVRTQAAMHGEDLLVDDCCNGQAVEAICERFPQFDVISSFALVVKAVDTVNGGAFMVAA